jgi:hypothetical protein
MGVRASRNGLAVILGAFQPHVCVDMLQPNGLIVQNDSRICGIEYLEPTTRATSILRHGTLGWVGRANSSCQAVIAAGALHPCAKPELLQPDCLPIHNVSRICGIENLEPLSFATAGITPRGVLWATRARPAPPIAAVALKPSTIVRVLHIQHATIRQH